MKVIAIAILLALASLSGGYWYVNQQTDVFGISVKITPVSDMSTDSRTLTVEIIPKEHIEGDFRLELIPQKYGFVTISKDGIMANENNTGYLFAIKDQMIDIGDNRPYTFTVLGKCESVDATWEIYVYVAYKPKGKAEWTEEDCARVKFQITNPTPELPKSSLGRTPQTAVPPTTPSFQEGIERWVKGNLGALIIGFFCGMLVCYLFRR